MSRTGSFTGAGLGGKAKLRLWERDGGLCHICREPVNNLTDATRDHIVPLSAGGCTCTGNIALAHRGCNSRRGSVAIGAATVGRKGKRRPGHTLAEHKP
jgi:5-methylcytosine-specific restriction endonuclease McrA